MQPPIAPSPSSSPSVDPLPSVVIHNEDTSLSFTPSDECHVLCQAEYGIQYALKQDTVESTASDSAVLTAHPFDCSSNPTSSGDNLPQCSLVSLENDDLLSSVLSDHPTTTSVDSNHKPLDNVPLGNNLLDDDRSERPSDSPLLNPYEHHVAATDVFQRQTFSTKTCEHSSTPPFNLHLHPSPAKAHHSDQLFNNVPPPMHDRPDLCSTPTSRDDPFTRLPSDSSQFHQTTAARPLSNNSASPRSVFPRSRSSSNLSDQSHSSSYSTTRVAAARSVSTLTYNVLSLLLANFYPNTPPDLTPITDLSTFVSDSVVTADSSLPNEDYLDPISKALPSSSSAPVGDIVDDSEASVAEEAVLDPDGPMSTTSSPSILRSGTLSEFQQQQQSGVVCKRVRFSLSDAHPSQDLEDEFGGRSNRKRLMDLECRRCRQSYLSSSSSSSLPYSFSFTFEHHNLPNPAFGHVTLLEFLQSLLRDAVRLLAYCTAYALVFSIIISLTCLSLHNLPGASFLASDTDSTEYDATKSIVEDEGFCLRLCHAVFRLLNHT